MSYIPPAGDAIDFDLQSGYSIPLADAVDFVFSNANILQAATTAPHVVFIASHEAEIVGALASTLTTPSVDFQAAFYSGREIKLSSVTPNLQSSAIAMHGVSAKICANTLPPVNVIAVQWGDKIPPIPSIGVDIVGGIRWGTADTGDHEHAIPFNDAPTKQSTSTSVWTKAAKKQAHPGIGFSATPFIDTQASAPWTCFDQWLSPDTEALSNYAPPMDLNTVQGWSSFDQLLAHDHSDPWHYSPPQDVGSNYPHQRTELWGNKLIWDTRDYTSPESRAVDFAFDTAYIVPGQLLIHFDWGEASLYPNQPIRPTDPGKQIAHNAPPTIDESRQVIWGDGSWSRPVPDYEWTPEWETEAPEAAPRPAQPQIREVYIFMPVLMLYRIPDGAEINATNVSWATDADSWGWRFNATIKQESDLSLLKHDSNGPREIACEINGHTFKGMVESYSRSRQFGETAITIKGRSLSGWLSDPYAPKRSKAIDATYTAQQLAEQELTNTGWTLDWQTADWLIPSGAFSYHELDPIAVIKRIAATAGAIVQSHPSNKQLIIKPRYPVSPHKWNDPSTTLDAILPAALIQQAGSEFLKLPTYNRAICAGGATGGVIVTLTRDGTAGDELAPIITNDLITHQEAGYERGRNEIAKGGSWEMMNFTTWLTPQGQSPGLMLPGYLVEIQDTDTTYPVQIVSTTINAHSSNDALTVRQQLTAERKINV